MALISVIVPVYNVEPYLKRCVDSILAQTFSDFDLVLIDDGSPDRCGEICDRYAEKDKRIHVIHQENGGLSVARNAGIDWAFEHSDSEWITFIDSDDWVHPEYLRIMLKSVKESKLKISVCYYQKVYGEIKTKEYEKINVEKAKPEEFFVETPANATVAWGKVYKKCLFEYIRYPEGKLHEDVYVTHLLMFNEEYIALVHEALYYYYSNANGIVNSASVKKIKDAVEGQRLRIQYFKENNYLQAYNYEINSIGYNAVELQAMNQGAIEEDRVYRREIIGRIRKKIRRDKISFKKQVWIYELAYPNLMKGYWLFIAIVRRIKK